MSSNIFIDYHEKVNGSIEDRVGSGWEDFFTEMLYFYLCCDREVLEDLCKTVLREDFEPPVKLETQFQQGGARPDLVIHLASGRLLILEHKVEQGLRPGQLDDYLKIVGEGRKSCCVALFSARTQHIPAQVLADSCYKKPTESGDHYYWQELYQLIRTKALDSLGTDNLRTFFLDYMALLGFAPSALTEKWRRLLEDRLIPENKDVQEEFGRRLAGVRSFLKSTVGFKVSKVSHKGCIGEPRSKRAFCRLAIEPRRARAHFSSAGTKPIGPDVLSVFLVYDNGEAPPHAQMLAGSFPDPFEDSLGNKWFPMKPYTMTSGKRTRLEFVANLESFLKEPDAEIQNRLTTACSEVIEKLLELDRDVNGSIAIVRR